jgi:hypothetical protein
MADDISIKIDTTQYFNAMNEYMKYSHRSNEDAVNIHAKYVAGNWFGLIPTAKKDKVKSDLMSPSDNNPKAPIAAILVNKNLGKKGKKGLYGEAMAKAVEKFIRVRQSHVNYLRSGAALAYKLMKLFVPKSYKPEINMNDIKVIGLINGGAKPARTSLTDWTPMASIWSQVKVNNAESVKKIEMAAQQAVNKETVSMVEYIKQKQNEFWKI